MRRMAYIILFIIITLTACQQYTEEEQQIIKSDVIIGTRNYISSLGQTYILKNILEQAGYDVYVDITNEDELWNKLSSNNINVVNSAWFYETDYYDYKLIEKQVTDMGVNSKYYKKGLVVPSYVQIADISELDMYQNKFDGIVYCIDEAEYLYDRTSKVLENYNLDYFIKEVTEDQLDEILDNAYKEEKWVVFAAYSPHYMFNKYPLRFLEDYKKEFGGKQEIHTLINTDFYVKNKEIDKLLDSFYIYEHELNSLLFTLHQAKDDEIESVTQKWLEEHPDIIDRALGYSLP